MISSGPRRRTLLGTALATPFIRPASAAEPLTIWHDLGDNGGKWFAAQAELFAATHPGFALRPTNYPTDQWFGPRDRRHQHRYRARSDLQQL